MSPPHAVPASPGVRAGHILGRAATGTSTSPGLGVPARLDSSCLTAHGTGAGQGSCPMGDWAARSTWGIENLAEPPCRCWYPCP